MRKLNPTRIISETFTLLLPTGVFLLLYAARYSADFRSLVDHASLALPAALALTLFRALIHNSGNGGISTILIALVYTSWFAATSAFYFVVLIGIESWGMIPTWRLIAAYLPNLQELLSTLGIPPWSGLLAVLMTTATLLFFSFRIITRPQPAGTWQLEASATLLLICIGSSGLLAAHQFYEAKAGFNRGSREPLMLTLNPGLAPTANRQIADQSPSTLTRNSIGEREQYVPTTDFVARNVILIVGDALRADRMSLFGHSRKTTPFLDELESSGRLALNVRGHSVCAESFCGLLALSRSKFVHEMPGNSPNLAEVLRLHGYAVHFVLGGDHTNFYGLADALGPYDSFWDGTQSDAYVNDDKSVLQHARNLPRFNGNPTFLQFHLMSTV